MSKFTFKNDLFILSIQYWELNYMGFPFILLSMEGFIEYITLISGLSSNIKVYKSYLFKFSYKQHFFCLNCVFQIIYLFFIFNCGTKHYTYDQSVDICYISVCFFILFYE